MLRPVSEVADWKPGWDRPVDALIQFSRTASDTTWVFVRDLVKAASLGFVETAVEHVGLLFFAKKAGAQRFIIDARASNRHFLRPPSGPLLTGEGLCHVGFQGTPEDAHNLFVGSADIKKAFIRCGFLGGRRRFSNCPLL